MTSKAKPRTIAASMSASHLAGVFDEPQATIRDILLRAGLVSVKGQWDLKEAALAVKKHFKTKAESINARTESDRARKSTAEADSAEMAAAKEAGKLCMIDDYRNNYADAIAQGVQAISRLAIPAAHKELVFAALRGVKLADLEADEN